jgi:hypothetical protein
VCRRTAGKQGHSPLRKRPSPAHAPSMTTRRRLALQIAAGLVAVAVLIQLVPIGRDHGNPPVTSDAPWATAADRRLAVSACYDCHSNETQWRWYTSVAPVSWWTASHVREGREILNFSEWDRRQRETHEMGESVEERSMPPWSYTIEHGDARLSQAERDQLVRALQALPDPGRP